MCYLWFETVTVSSKESSCFVVPSAKLKWHTRDGTVITRTFVPLLVDIRSSVCFVHRLVALNILWSMRIVSSTETDSGGRHCHLKLSVEQDMAMRSVSEPPNQRHEILAFFFQLLRSFRVCCGYAIFLAFDQLTDVRVTYVTYCVQKSLGCVMLISQSIFGLTLYRRNQSAQLFALGVFQFCAFRR
jgi:hypothetical protein